MRFSFFFPKPNGATRTRFECILMHLVPFLDVSGEKTVFEEKYFSEICPDFREIRVSGGPPRALPDLADLDAQIMWCRQTGQIGSNPRRLMAVLKRPEFVGSVDALFVFLPEAEWSH